MTNNSTPEPLSSGKIESLPFGGNANPFGLMFISKAVSAAVEPQLSSGWDIIPDVRLYHDSAASPLFLSEQMPEPVFSDTIIWYLPNTTTNQAIFAAYDIYWQSGEARPLPATVAPSPTGKPYIGNDVVKLTNGVFRHGEVTSLPFGNGTPFKFICISKADAAINQNEPDLPGSSIFLDLKLTHNPSVEHTFVQKQRRYTGNPDQWSPMNVARIANTPYNANILQHYRIFWLSGEHSPAE